MLFHDQNLSKGLKIRVSCPLIAPWELQGLFSCGAYAFLKIDFGQVERSKKILYGHLTTLFRRAIF